MRIVAKFGGTSLGSGDRIAAAARSVAAAIESGHEVVVVASAMGELTDHLLDEISFDVDERARADILSMGERTSVRMLSAALSARGIDATYVEPGDEHWPVAVTGDGEVDADRTADRGRALFDATDGAVPVVTGFLAERPDGSLATLGRGGSDTTAVLLGSAIDADEVVIVTDVPGIMTANPAVVDGARTVNEIDIDEARTLSIRGADVIAPDALQYKKNGVDLRVTHYRNGDLSTGGTRVDGAVEWTVHLRERPLARIAVVGSIDRDRARALRTISTALDDAGVEIDTVTADAVSVSVYVDASGAREARNRLHETIVSDPQFTAVTLQESAAAIRIADGTLLGPVGNGGHPGPFDRAEVPVLDVVTSATATTVFVPWADRRTALAVARRSAQVECNKQ